MSGSYDFTGLGSDPRTMRGGGKVEVTNGDVFAIPIFGPLSGILNHIVPGSGYSIAHQASATFKINDGIIHTDDFEAASTFFSMLGHGDIHFLDDKLDFDVRLNMKGPGVLLTPVYKLFEYTGEGQLEEAGLAPEKILDFRFERSEESRRVTKPIVKSAIDCAIAHAPSPNNSSRRPHVDRWRRADVDRARLFDRVHRDADFREKQHAVVRPAADPRGDSRLFSNTASATNYCRFSRTRII